MYEPGMRGRRLLERTLRIIWMILIGVGIVEGFGGREEVAWMFIVLSKSLPSFVAVRWSRQTYSFWSKFQSYL